MTVTKIKYLFSSIIKKISGHKDVCPFCTASLAHAQVIDSKLYVLQLKKCSCGLLVRTPTDSIQESNTFYQKEYDQGITTDCPHESSLQNMVANGFKNSERNYDGHIKLLKDLNIQSGSRILDFGCSWGYGVYQLNKAGYDATGYEISKPRLQYGIDKLKIRGVSDTAEIEGDLDVFFSAHVLEHVPDLQFVFDIAKKLLKPGGLFIAVTPNGSEAFRKNNKFNFHKLWGKVHPVLLTDDFVNHNFKADIKILGSYPLQNVYKQSDKVYTEVADKWELLICLQYQKGIKS